MNRTKTIYGLYVEGEDMPRYVGATRNIRARITVHHSAIRFTSAIYGIELPDLGLQIKAIEETEENNWKERERYWIKHYKELGAELANADPKETRIKRRKARSGKYIRTPEMRKRIGQSSKRGHRLRRDLLALEKEK